VNAGAGYNVITDNAGGNTIVVPAAGQGWDRIVGNSFTDGDTFDMRTALAATTWDGKTADLGLGSVLQAAAISTGNSLHINTNQGGSWTPVLILWGQGTQTLAAFEKHALL